MTKDEFEREGFTYEILPSGHLNVYNKEPFRLNDCVTICCWSGRYLRTTTYKSFTDLLTNVRLETVELASIRPASPVKKKTHKTKEVVPDQLSPLTNQSLAEFLTTESESPPKKRRSRKS